MKNSHKLPTLARLSLNGNLLIEHPLTKIFHWFKANGEYLCELAYEENTNGEGQVPEYVWNMIVIPINRFDGTWAENNFIARFPTIKNDFSPSPNRLMGVKDLNNRRGNGHTNTNIFGRRFKTASNPKQFRLDYETQIYYYVCRPSTKFGGRR